MDILTHTLSGFAAGTVVAGLSNKGLKRGWLIIAIGGVAGALPDIDAISLWSGFDITFGKLFNLSHTGREIYSAKFWYSHHAFMHSLAAALLISVLAALFTYLAKEKFKQFNLSGLKGVLVKHRFIYISFIFGYVIHLLQDMPTPASTWGGVSFFWPSKDYIGGFGHIWWWNNYDIFLIVSGVLLLNVLMLSSLFIEKNLVKRLVTSLFCIGLVFSLIQIRARDFDFAYSGSAKHYHEFESKSKELQKEILGEELYEVMVSFDNKLGIYF